MEMETSQSRERKKKRQANAVFFILLCKIGIFKKESHGNGGKSNGGKIITIFEMKKN